MQCKDIPERPILEWLKNREDNKLLWGTWFRGYENSIPMPEGVPEKLIIAKMRQMINKGLVSGCSCGCRGDYEITEDGLKALRERESHAT